MSTLVFDTTQDQVVAALVRDDGSVLAQSGADAGRAQALMRVIDALVGQSGEPRGAIARIAVGVGPGSFTAIRIGVTVARGLAFALRVPLAGLDTLAAVAIAAAAEAQDHVVVWSAVDARRGEVFARAYRRESGFAGFTTQPQGPVHAVPVADLEALVGGAPVGSTITVAALAELAVDPSAAYGDPALILPSYGREPDAVPTADRAAVVNA